MRLAIRTVSRVARMRHIRLRQEEEERARDFARTVLIAQQGSESVQVVGSDQEGEEITITRNLLDLPRNSLSA